MERVKYKPRAKYLQGKRKVPAQEPTNVPDAMDWYMWRIRHMVEVTLPGLDRELKVEWSPGDICWVLFVQGSMYGVEFSVSTPFRPDNLGRTSSRTTVARTTVGEIISHVYNTRLTAVMLREQEKEKDR